MGVWDAITEVLEAAMPWGEVEAEAPSEETQETQVGPLQNPLHYGDRTTGLVRRSLTRHLSAGEWEYYAKGLEC